MSLVARETSEPMAALHFPVNHDHFEVVFCRQVMTDIVHKRNPPRAHQERNFQATEMTPRSLILLRSTERILFTPFFSPAGIDRGC